MPLPGSFLEVGPSYTHYIVRVDRIAHCWVPPTVRSYDPGGLGGLGAEQGTTTFYRIVITPCRRHLEYVCANWVKERTFSPPFGTRPRFFTKG